MIVAPPVVLPDAEALIIGVLTGLPELSDLGGRIYSVVPKNRVFPLARVFRYGGDPMFSGSPYWLDSPSLQVDVWADGRSEARRLGEQLRAACAQQICGVWTDGTIVSTLVSALVNSADPAFSPNRPRYRFTMTAVIHPLKAATDLIEDGVSER